MLVFTYGLMIIADDGCWPRLTEEISIIYFASHPPHRARCASPSSGNNKILFVCAIGMLSVRVRVRIQKMLENDGRKVDLVRKIVENLWKLGD